MTTIRQELRRLWHTLLGRGVVMFVLGLGAVLWPEDVLIAAMISVGVLTTLFGLYEITIALPLRKKTAGWMLVLVHGSAVLLFGVLTAAAPGLTLRIALAIIAGWMLAYAALAIATAILVWQARGVRSILLGWAALDVIVAFVTVLYPEATIFSLLYFGAVYAAVFGAWQIFVGLWLRRALKHPPYDLHLEVFATAHS